MYSSLLPIAIVLIIVGIAGTFLPIIPGPLLVFAGLLLAALNDGFTKVGVPTLIFLGLLVALCYVVDFLATLFGVKKVGASKLAVLGSAIGGVVGLFFGFAGVVIGPFVGAAAGEYLARRDVKQAGKAGVGSWLGFIFGAVAKLALIFVMIGTFLLSYILF